jgi:hypothetical protein
MAGGISRSQARRQQASGVTLEDQHGVIHVLAITAVEEAELLLAMSGLQSQFMGNILENQLKRAANSPS